MCIFDKFFRCWCYQNKLDVVDFINVFFVVFLFGQKEELDQEEGKFGFNFGVGSLGVYNIFYWESFKLVNCYL